MTTAIASLNEKFAKDNDFLVERTQVLFSQFCGEHNSTWRFFNTLSYMEHIGSYKIMATQMGSSMDYQTLKHLQEESGHAVLFKRHAERIRGDNLDYSDAMLMVPATAYRYFARLEVLISQMFRASMNRRTVYLYMSMIVEFRAVWAYAILQQSIDQAGLDLSLTKLLAEEQGHLYSMARRLEADGHFDYEKIDALCHKERAQFVRLLNALDTEMAVLPRTIGPPIQFDGVLREDIGRLEVH